MTDSAVILAVGSPMHQSQLIYNRPRAMLPALGKPLVVRTMERLYRSGIQHYAVIVGEDEGALAAYLNAHWFPNVQIEFVLHSNKRSIAQTLIEIAEKRRSPFFFAAYNSFTHPNFPERLHKQGQEHADALTISGAPASLSTAAEQHVALVDNHRVTAIVETRSPSGASVLTDFALCGRRFVDYLATHQPTSTWKGKREFVDLVHGYLRSGAETYMVEAAWTLQIETDHDLLTLNRHLLDEEQDAHILSELPGTVQIIPPVRIDPQVSVGRGATIGPYTYLENGCSVGHGAVVRHSIVLQKASVRAGEHISNAIVSTRVRIQA